MKQAWNDVGEGFSTLGRMMKDRYRGAGGDVPGDGATEDAADAGHDPLAGLRDAFERLVAAGRELGDRASEVARDDEVRAQAKRAAESLNDALSATVDLIGDEVGGLFGRSKRAETPPEISSPEPPADDTSP